MADKLKSAYELAMERLQAKDRDAGVERKPLTKSQKTRIAELRGRAQAKLAELEILHRKNLQSVTEPERREEIEQQYQTDRQRVESSLESSIARVRRGESD